MRSYYDKINGRQYSTTWQQLSPKLQTNYSSYTGWWNSVDSVEFGNVKLLNRNQKTAKLEANLTYQMKDGRTDNERLRIWMVWDEASGKWLFDETQRQ